MSVHLKALPSLTKEHCEPLYKQGTFQVMVVLYARSIDLKALAVTKHGQHYCALPLPDHGICLIYQYGALVFFNANKEERERVYSFVEAHADKPFPSQETEAMDVQIHPKLTNKVEPQTIILTDASPDHLEVVGDVLSKSIKMDQFEVTVADSFSKVEPIALNLKNKGKLDHTSTQLLKHIGDSLFTEHEIIGRIEMIEKPLILWDHAELEPLYYQLMDEFEIVERHTILDKKIELIARTAQSSLEVLQHRHASRLEWYIIILIIVSICLELYALIVH